MHTKKFLIQFQGDETTHWLHPDSELLYALRFLAGSFGTAHTNGRKPAVTVTIEEKPEASENVSAQRAA